MLSPSLALAVAGLAAIVAPASVTDDVRSTPLADTSSVRAALRSAHGATLRIERHPRGRVARASRICRGPDARALWGDAVEERGLVDLDARRFNFVRRPFGAPSRFVGDVAEAPRAHAARGGVAGDEHPALRAVGLQLAWDDASGLHGSCDDDGASGLEGVDVTAFRGFFDGRACRRAAREGR